jgi:hypothetical protein
MPLGPHTADDEPNVLRFVTWVTVNFVLGDAGHAMIICR